MKKFVFAALMVAFPLMFSTGCEAESTVIPPVGELEQRGGMSESDMKAYEESMKSGGSSRSTAPR